MNKIKHDNFVRISSNRKEKILNIINQLNNLSNLSFYEYSADEIKSIFNDINNKCKAVEDLLIKSIKKKGNM